VLGRGFVETNDDLDIDPDDEEALDELKEQSLVFLYRLMFVLYAEARGLIHPEDRAAQDEYDQNFSLDELRLDIHDAIGEVDEGFEDEFSDYSTTMWSRLKDLFRLIDEGEEALGIPPYNGGLFDHEEHDFLTDHEVSNRYLAEVIYRLSTAQNDEGRYVLADYADLDTRHLGSVYEGLLEHQFRIAPEQYAAVAENGGQVWKPATEVSVVEAVETVPEGGLYVVNDEGERKATGAYYTPDYVVTYIVEETVGPLVEEIREDLIDQGFEPGTQEYIGPFFRRVTDLRILDPAMGSGHFLTKATGYLSEQVMAEVREAEEEFGVAFDEQHIRREIAKECIYGVDLNGMAVELAKLSMWLETLAADRPLAFLNHHFKQGNSLVGSDIEAIEELESDASDDDQYSLAEFGATREGTIERLMDIYSEFLAIENESVEDVREMKRKYAEIEQDELRKRLVAMANVHTAERFGLNIPGGAYERMAKALEDDSEWDAVEGTDWFTTAQVMADEQDFFHWKLAFPEAFYEEDGSGKEDSGFDVVLGNPPWVNIGRQSNTQELVSYLKTAFKTAEYQVDLYTLFLERSVVLCSQRDFVGMIVPDPWLANYRTPKIREHLLVDNDPQKIVHTPRDAFPGVEAEHLIVILRPDENATGHFKKGEMDKLGAVEWFDEYPVSLLREDDGYVVYWKSDISGTIEKIEENTEELGDLFETIRGVGPYHHNHQSQEIIDERAYHSDEKKNEDFVPELKGKHLSRYHSHWEGDTWIKYGPWLAEPREDRFFEGKRLLLREILGDRFQVTVLEEKFVVDRGIYIALQDNSEVDLYYVLALLASPVPVFWFRKKYSEDDELFPKLRVAHFEMLPIVSARTKGEGDSDQLIKSWEGLLAGELSYDAVLGEFQDYIEPNQATETIHQSLAHLAEQMCHLHQERDDVNLDLLDYLKPYSDGPSLTNIGIYQPTEGVGDTKFTATKEDYENIRVGTVMCEREDETTVTIHATARYKPDDEDAYETDRWGYTETEPMPAMRLTDLSETEADLVESFVPVAVGKAGGFAGFRETATKTNSLVDRLEAITLPDTDDVADDLERYRESVERAEELDEKIQRTDDLIDEIVYELYGLTDEEIEIVEEAVSAD
jgi:type I restriction-modification system DNA methylase subunit